MVYAGIRPHQAPSGVRSDKVVELDFQSGNCKKGESVSDCSEKLALATFYFYLWNGFLDLFVSYLMSNELPLNLLGIEVID